MLRIKELRISIGETCRNRRRIRLVNGDMVAPGSVWDRPEAKARRPVLLQVEHFLQHGEALAALLVGDGFEEAAHGLLPALVDGVFVELIPSLVEIFGG